MGRNHGAVYVVRDGMARRTEVKLGADNGSLVEVLSGIGPDDAVIVHSAAPLEDGIRVTSVALVTETADRGRDRASARSIHVDR